MKLTDIILSELSIAGEMQKYDVIVEHVSKAISEKYDIPNDGLLQGTIRVAVAEAMDEINKMDTINEGWNDRDAEGKLSQLDYGTVSSYFDGEKFSAPNPDDSLRQINGESDWESWKEKTIDRYGDVTIKLDKEAVWYDKVKILDPVFNKAKDNYITSKAATLDKWRKSPDYYAGD